MSIEHNVITTPNIHPLPGLGPYADEAARLAASVGAADVDKAAVQTDTGARWILSNNSPMRWDRYSGPMPVRPQSGAGTYTCTMNDKDALVPMTSASATAPTIPPNSSVPFKIGDTILFQQQGAGLMTITPGAGVTFEGTSFVSSGVGSVLCATQRIANTWVIYGKTT
jgi:hypothetical protein